MMNEEKGGRSNQWFAENKKNGKKETRKHFSKSMSLIFPCVFCTRYFRN